MGAGHYKYYQAAKISKLATLLSIFLSLSVATLVTVRKS